MNTESAPARRDAAAQFVSRVAGAQARFEAAIKDVDDAAVRAPSALPGWTVGHLLSHVARNADSHVRRTDAAAKGLMVEQYPGGREGRAAEIEKGSRMPAAKLVSEVRKSGAAVLAAWSTLPEHAWSNPILDVTGRQHPLLWLPSRRWQELEIHLVDLNVGITYADWPNQFVTDRLVALRPAVSGRLPAGSSAPPEGMLTDREELAWMFGRLVRVDLPELASWE